VVLHASQTRIQIGILIDGILQLHGSETGLSVELAEIALVESNSTHPCRGVQNFRLHLPHGDLAHARGQIHFLEILGGTEQNVAHARFNVDAEDVAEILEHDISHSRFHDDPTRAVHALDLDIAQAAAEVEFEVFRHLGDQLSQHGGLVAFAARIHATVAVDEDLGIAGFIFDDFNSQDGFIAIAGPNSDIAHMREVAESSVQIDFQFHGAAVLELVAVHLHAFLGKVLHQAGTSRASKEDDAERENDQNAFHGVTCLVSSQLTGAPGPGFASFPFN